MAIRSGLLDSLLDLLVREWGRKEVESALARRLGAAGDALRENKGKRKYIKPRASEQVARAQISKAQETALRELAARFDSKQFLPSISDVREFLIMMGERPSGMKDRSEAFRELLKALIRFSPERLESLAASANHHGPSQLGPLSDAISAAASSLPRHRESGDS